MKKRQLLCIGILAAFFLCPPTRGFTFEDAIIAVVNNELITLKNLKDYARSTYIGLVAEGVDERQIRAVMDDLETTGIGKLIEDKLILSEAKKVNLTVREEMVDDRIKEMEKKYGSEQNLIDALIKTGATMTDLRNKIRDQLKIQYIIDHAVRSKIHVNPQEVTDYYEHHKDDFGKSERANLESIFIKSTGDNDAEASAKADKVIEEIKQGKPFKDVAKEYSEAPSVGVVERGQLLPNVEDVVFKLRVGKVSPPVKVDNGIYIFKVDGYGPAKTDKLDNVKDQIHEVLFKEKFKKQLTDWLAKLKKDAYIEIKQ